MSFRDFFLLRLAWVLFGLWLAATVVFLMFFVLPAPERDFVGGSQARPAAIECLRSVPGNRGAFRGGRDRRSA